MQAVTGGTREKLQAPLHKIIRTFLVAFKEAKSSVVKVDGLLVQGLMINRRPSDDVSVYHHAVEQEIR